MMRFNEWTKKQTPCFPPCVHFVEMAFVAAVQCNEQPLHVGWLCALFLFEIC